MLPKVEFLNFVLHISSVYCICRFRLNFFAQINKTMQVCSVYSSSWKTHIVTTF